MNFKLSAPERSHGIQVIGEIPDLPLCRVEGLNGIGKTLAIHLLEICAGHQPYSTRPSAWRTLCEYLGPAEVVVDGLRADRAAGANGENHTLRFAFDWRNRDDRTAPRDITADLFDEILLDGAPVANMQEVRRWLNVVRIAGDQSLTETVAGVVANDRELLRAAASVAHSRSDQGDRVLTDMLRAFPLEPAQRAVEVAGEGRVLAQRQQELEEMRKRQREKLERLELARVAQIALADVSANADVLGSEIVNLREQLDAARERTKQTSTELEAARERERLSTDAETKLQEAEKIFARLLAALKRAEDAAEKRAAEISIAAERDAVNAALEELEQSRRKASQEGADLKDLFALRDLLDGLVQALAPAAAGGLRARTVATVGDQIVTAGDLLDAVRLRRERLLTDAPAVDELDTRLAELEQREKRLTELQNLIAKRDKKREELAASQQALEALGETDSQSGDSIAEKSAAHAAAQRVETELGSALGATERQLAQLGGGLSLEDLQAERDRRLAEADTTEAKLDKELGRARGQLAALDDQLDDTTTRRDAVDAISADLERILVGQARALQAENTHARLRSVLGDRAPDPGGDLDNLARAWLEAHSASDRAVRRLQGARSDLDRLSGAMNELVDVIRHGDTPSPELDPVRRLYQERLLKQFSQRELLDALFDGGKLTRIDLAAGEVVWETATGEPRVRPFEAFSSGERAFAYAQARLAAVADLTASNKIVAVDEFGAFLSRDRLIRLQEAVERQLAAGVVDQAIVILPLSRTDDLGTAGGSGYSTGTFDALTVV
jgi:hypothetical protein